MTAMVWMLWLISLLPLWITGSKARSWLTDTAQWMHCRVHRMVPCKGTTSYHLYTAWSTQGIAAVLTQRDADGKEYTVACVSRLLNEHEKHYKV